MKKEILLGIIVARGEEDAQEIHGNKLYIWGLQELREGVFDRMARGEITL